jgi:hypothetical protein
MVRQNKQTEGPTKGLALRSFLIEILLESHERFPGLAADSSVLYPVNPMAVYPIVAVAVFRKPD